MTKTVLDKTCWH